MRSFLLGLTGVAAMLVCHGPVDAGLVGHWTFDSDFGDSVGTNHGTATGATLDPAGMVGGAASFDGNDDRVVIPQNVIPAPEFTVAFWEYSPGASGTNAGYMIGAGAGSGFDDVFLRRFPGAGSTADNYAGGITQVVAGQTFGDFGPYAREAWHHHVVTHAGGRGRWYVDGDLAAVQPSSTFAGLTDDLFVGNRKDLQRDFLGKIDDLQVYDQWTAPSQAKALFDTPGSTVQDTAPQLVGHWKFDGNLNDSAGTKHGTQIGGATAGTTNGQIGGAVRFDGNNDGVRIDADQLVGQAFSVSFWEFSEGTSNEGYFMAAGSNSAGTDDFFLRRRTGGDFYNGGLNFGAGASPDGAQFDDFPGSGVSREEWHHNVVVFDNSTGDSLAGAWYVDGVLVRTTHGGRVPSADLFSDDLFVGIRKDLDRDFLGLIDDLQLYDGLLSAADAAFLFDNPGAVITAASVIPEPASAAIWALGLLGAAWGIRRRRR